MCFWVISPHFLHASHPRSAAFRCIHYTTLYCAVQYVGAPNTQARNWLSVMYSYLTLLYQSVLQPALGLYKNPRAPCLPSHPSLIPSHHTSHNPLPHSSISSIASIISRSCSIVTCVPVLPIDCYNRPCLALQHSIPFFFYPFLFLCWKPISYSNLSNRPPSLSSSDITLFLVYFSTFAHQLPHLHLSLLGCLFVFYFHPNIRNFF